MNNHSECTLSQRRKRPMDLVLYALIYLCAAFAVLLLAGAVPVFAENAEVGAADAAITLPENRHPSSELS